jgi:hypothetical protein
MIHRLSENKPARAGLNYDFGNSAVSRRAYFVFMIPGWTHEYYIFFKFYKYKNSQIVEAALQLGREHKDKNK